MYNHSSPILSLNKHMKAAIIYSVDHLFSYIIQIRDGNKSYFLSENNEIIKFGNMDDARRALLRHNVKVAFLALSKTSEETDLTTCHTKHGNFDYSPVKL